MRIITMAKLLGLVATLAAAGCGNDNGPAQAGSGATSSTTEATTSTTRATSTTGGIDPLVGADAGPKSGPVGATEYGQLVDVRIGRHEGFDRVVFAFRGNGVPGFRVEYVNPPIHQDASGDVVEVDGDAFLLVHMEPASGFDMDAGKESYTGSRRLEGSAAGTSQVQEVVNTGDFEAVLSWVVGLADRVDFRVDTLTNPGRIVVDVRNH
jgi:hypothetical protein